MRPPPRKHDSATTATSRYGGVASSYVLGQTQGAAANFATARGERLGSAHLLVALLDQGDAETLHVLLAVGIDTAALRRATLLGLGASPHLPAIAMPSLTPAGTMNRPALDVDELDLQVWKVLTWRQNHLPIDRVRGVADVAALASAEERAGWKLADQAGVGDDQRYSLLWHHGQAVGQRLAQSHPALAAPQQASSVAHFMIKRSRHHYLPKFMVGWPTWLSNRRVGVRDRWFTLVTRSAFRDQPSLHN